MSTKSFTSLRRFSGYALTPLIFCMASTAAARAQSTTPIVTASYATSLAPPSGGISKVYQTALDSFGDLLVEDWGNGALYEYPANGGAVITLLPNGSLGSYSNPGIAIGAANDLYLEGNYNNCLDRFPYDPATKSWDGLSTISAANGFNSQAPCPNGKGGNYTATPPYGFSEGGNPGVSPYYFQPWALAIDPNNNVVVTAQNSGNFIFTMPVNGTGVTSTAGSAASLNLVASAARAQSVAEDKFGNIYFVEETDQKGALPGVLMVPAGSTNVASDAGLTRVDPNLPAVTGVTVDAAGNLYISDSSKGVFMVPNPSGTPQTSSAVLLTPTPAYGQASIDWKRDILYVPGYNASGAQVIEAVTFSSAELGAAATASTTPATTSVLFGFNGAATPGSFVIQEAGAATPDFTIAKTGTCVAGTAQAAQSSCTVSVQLTPHAAGSVSAKLLMLDASGNVLSSINLHGTGTGSSVQVLPGAENMIGAGLKTPSQIAADPGKNVYVADAGLGAVEMYPKGSGASTAGTAVGTGLKAPTGVAADGGGDVFIADSGSVIEVPQGSKGLNAAGQVTVKSGLGSNLKLAVDGTGNLFIANPDNHQVIKLASVGGTFNLYSQIETDFGGFSAPSALAVDPNGNLYVADGSNLYEITPAGVQSTLLSGWTGATGLAVDPSGAVYATASGHTVRIPNEGGTLNVADQTMIAGDDSSPTSVALDPAGDIYITNAGAGNIEMIGSSASVNFGTLSTTSATASQDFTILNDGNATLNISGFSGTADYSETATTCGATLAVNSTCSVTVTFSPGPGDQGTLTGAVLVTGDEANVPSGINAVGVGAALGASSTTLAVANPTVDGAPASVTVAPTSGKGTAPSGTVTLTITGTSLTSPVVVTGTLDASGKATLAPPQLAAGAYSYAVSYGGDRAYGKSSASQSVTVAPGPVNLIQPTMAQVQQNNPAYPYVLATGPGAAEPYDGSIVPYEYTYPVQVVATDGVPLIGQPVYDSKGKLVAMNYGSVTFQGASGASCAPVAVASDGTAPFSTTCFTIDTSNNAIPDLMTTYTVTPVYNPAGTGGSAGYTNPNYTSVTGSSISFTALRNPVVQISSNPSTLTVSAGSTTTATLTLSSLLGYGVAGKGALLNNYSLPVQLACDGLPAYASCSFSYPTPDPSDPQSVDVTPTAPGKVIMTINTNVVPPTVASLRRSPGSTAFAAMFGLGLVGFAFGKKRSLRSGLLTLGCLIVCAGVVAGISGCSTTQLGVTKNTPTPSGTYNVVVTAKQVGSQAISASPGIVYGSGNQMSLPFTVKVTVQ